MLKSSVLAVIMVLSGWLLSPSPAFGQARRHRSGTQAVSSRNMVPSTIGTIALLGGVLWVICRSANRHQVRE